MYTILLSLLLFVSSPFAAEPTFDSPWTRFDARHDADYQRGEALGATVSTPSARLRQATAVGLLTGGLTSGLILAGTPSATAGPQEYALGALVVGVPMFTAHFLPVPACDRGQSEAFTAGCRLSDRRAPERHLRRRAFLSELAGAAITFGVYAAVAEPGLR
jgi:hypothetical protein